MSLEVSAEEQHLRMVHRTGKDSRVASPAPCYESSQSALPHPPKAYTLHLPVCQCLLKKPESRPSEVEFCASPKETETWVSSRERGWRWRERER